MRILMLTPYLPYPLVSGGQIRTYNLLKNLKDKHDITLFSLIKNNTDRGYIDSIAPFCREVKVFKRPTKPFTLTNIFRTGFSSYPFVVIRNLVPQTLSAVSRELSKNHYDLIHAETFYMMPNIPKTSIPTILVEQTIEYLGYQSYAQTSKSFLLKPFFSIDIAKIKYWEKHYWQTCSRLITMSQNDKDFIQTECPDIKQVNIVANGVDSAFFDAVPKRLPQNPTILFVGTFSWLPNVQAVTYLVEEVWPLIHTQIPSARLHIVGFSPTPEIQAFGKLPHVKVDGGVADIRTAYSEAHVLVAPVNWGKGTRYKILEAMATKTPIVATPLAVEGIAGIKAGTHLLTASSAQALADNTVNVLKNRSLQQKLAGESYQLVTRRYNWQAISRELDHVYQEIGAQK